MTLGEFVKALRNGRGLSHQQVADKGELNRNTVINLETDEPVKFDTLRTVLNVLELSPADWGRAANLWIRQQIGEADYVKYGVPSAAQKLIVSEQASLSKDARDLAGRLSAVDQTVRGEIIKSIDRPEVIECLRILNAFHDKVAARVATGTRRNRVLYENDGPGPSPRVAEGSKSRAGKQRSRRPKGRGASRG